MTEQPTPYPIDNAPIDDIEDALLAFQPDWADKLAGARKGLVAGAGFVAQLVQSNVLHGTAQSIATGILGGATLLGVYVVRNVDPPEVAYVAADEPASSDREPGTDPDGEHLPEHAAALEAEDEWPPGTPQPEA